MIKIIPFNYLFRISRLKIICLLFLMVNSGHSQEYKIANLELKGKIKSLDLFVLENNKEIPVELKTFDTKGNNLTFKTYFNGRLRTNERNLYYSNQIITELCDYCNDLDKEFLNFSIKENQKIPYSGAGTGDPKRKFKEIKTLDKNGKVIVSKTYTLEGYLIWTTKYVYDTNSNLLLEEKFDDENKKISYTKNTYAKGLLVEKHDFGKNYESITSYSYDKLNRKSKEILNHEKTQYEYSYEYATENDTTRLFMYSKYDEIKDRILNKTSVSYPQQKNTITKETIFYSGKPSSTTISEYDKNNLLLTRKNYNDKNELRSEFQYIFDTKGNWIELNYSYLVNSSYNGSDPKPVWRTKKYIRKIEYY